MLHLKNYDLSADYKLKPCHIGLRFHAALGLNVLNECKNTV